jgi:radical SAM superfamily enzyme YgiQ (UPF0313 family)
VELADYVITGEADLAFAALCVEIFAGRPPQEKIHAAALPHFGQIKLPYAEYTAEDIAQRVVYVEASRGCPFTCEFCLSSLDIPVRAVPLEQLLPEFKALLDRGLRQFKFVDRTFNLNINTSRALLQFFLDHWVDGLFLHFEMIPDRLPEGLRELIRRFPPGALQFEIGIQTFQELASQNISRRNNHARTAENFAFLRNETGVHIHADLIVGLPGEDAASFAAGFDRLLAMRPQEIQVGMLKRLRGTPIIRHDAEYAMRYASTSPYEVLQTRDIPFPEMQILRRFSKYWDLLGNSGNFRDTLPLLWSDNSSPYAEFSALAAFLYEKTQATDGIELQRLMRLIFDFLTINKEQAPEVVAPRLWQDYARSRTADRPPVWLKPYLPTALWGAPSQASAGLTRQRRHLK